jgi:predicted Zn-dependent protease
MAAGSSVAGFGLCWGCHSAPLTGRRQLLLVGKGQEVTLGDDAYEQTLQENSLSSNAAATAIVKRVGERIAAVSGQTDFDWRFELLQSSQQNAFCLPGGKVAIFEGILPVCQTETGLAVVMSHEVAHAIARHGSERMTHNMVSDSVKQGVDALVKAKVPNKRDLLLKAYGAASQYGVILPYSRKHELEADHIGIMLMARAGYDPAEAPEFWRRFGGSKESSQQPAEFLSTHPSDQRRSSELASLLPEARQYYSQASNPVGLGQSIPLA